MSSVAASLTNDIIGDLVAAEIDGEKLTDEAIIAFLRLLLPAGLETTYRSSGNLLYLLLTHPEQLAMVQQDRSLIPAAIEEGLRYETPLVMVMRTTTEEVEVSGHTIPANAQVDLCMGSANRDESRWKDANIFDIRPASPSAHLVRRRHPHVPRNAFGPDGNPGDAEQPVGPGPGLGSDSRRRDRRGVQDRGPDLPVSQQASRELHASVMKSRAAILHDVGGPWSVEEFELDPPKAGEVLVKMAAAGLCHSDDHILKGDMSAPNEVMRSMGLPTMFPTIGGHEGSGIVQEVGEGVTEFAPGDHVVMSFVAVCGQCRWCATGAEYICDAGIGTMIPGMPTDGTFRHHTADGRDLGHLAKVGTFAEHTVASTNSLVKIEQHLPLAPSALLSCAIPTGYGSVSNRSNMRAGDTVVVIGVGGIGTAAIQSARINGAAQIVAVDPVEFKQKSALRFGATHSAGSAEEAMDLVRGLTHGVMADAVVVSPSLMSREDVRDGVALTRKGGTCVLTGMTSQLTQSVKINLQEFILMNKTLAGTIFGSCNPKADIDRLAKLYQSGQLLLDEMITKRYRLDDINDAYADLLNGEIVRGIIDFAVA